MKPVFQTSFAPPDGNCLQACLASIFDLDLEDVPEFQYLYGTGAETDWNTRFTSWTVRKFKVQPLWIGIDGFVPLGYHLIGGKTPKGVEHVVVGHRGQIVHDPLPDGVKGFVPEIYVLFLSVL